MLTAVVGINWGDEGKGRMVDLFSAEHEIVVRYQGGNNAGHTVVNERGKFVLNLLPSGILRPGTVNVLGPGMVLDLEHLTNEVAHIREQGVAITPEHLKISDRATICMPYHKMMDILEEDRLADKKFGSTRRGIGPVYADKYMKKTLRTGDLLFPDKLREKLADLVEWKNITVQGYGHEPVSVDEMYAWLEKYAFPWREYLCNTTEYLSAQADAGKSILFEAQLGALRDIDFGIFPYTSSSSSNAGYACVGAGIPGSHVDRTVGIVKAYSTCVGEGPFTAEWFGDEAEQLRVAGGEYGASTGRPRRVGPIDLVATRYGCRIQGATEVALTKLDVLSYMKEIPVCTQYEVNGEKTDDFPFTAVIDEAKPVLTTVPGWGCDISGVRKYEDLPQAARDYVEYVEQAIGVHISYVSVGAGRDEIIYR